MKKRLEAELISIAHRILKLKNKSEIIELQKETLNLYEKLSILRFVEENYSDQYVEIPSDIEEKIENPIQKETEKPITILVSEDKTEEFSNTETPEATVIFQESEVITPKTETITEATEDFNETQITETLTKTVQEIEKNVVEEPIAAFEIKQVEETQQVIETNEDEFNPSTEEAIITEKIKVEVPIEEEKSVPVQNNIFEFDTNFQEFESQLANAKPNQTLSMFDEPEIEQITEKVEPEITFEEKVIIEETHVYESPKVVSINDSVKKNFNIGLNDKIAFEFHLFGGQSEDFNRVLSQLNSFETFDEAKEFIVKFVKPDYNNWFAKEEFENRFLEIIESKFI